MAPSSPSAWSGSSGRPWALTSREFGGSAHRELLAHQRPVGYGAHASAMSRAASGLRAERFARCGSEHTLTPLA
eukprot:CAMPEP_0179852416 /NCGR_PEP_ID=MMETSP0982-20121206/8790_1 /TAXON_ID=483367 /ORGANISM="non described non described, Strain CCMP 2436" /LENGTH=73 /DNA_ID=CAMNT_0021738037 /DNA_START=1036 /DNA_END=1254 /DNA_ORIENTATION=-